MSRATLPGSRWDAIRPLAPSKALNLLAAIGGFVTLLVTYRALGAHDLDLGLSDFTLSSGQVIAALVPAALGGFLAVGYLLLLPRMRSAIARLGGLHVQTLVGTAAFAALAMAVPMVRFSGHAEFTDLHELVGASAWGALAGLAVLKLVATALNVASGWRGGEFFPLLFAGAAAGAVALAFVPGLEPTAALVAGLGAATTVGLKKPLAVALICAFLIGGIALAPLIVGVGVGMLFARVASRK
ncbi:chloride channel protein [Janibacter sp. GXQ6167]|uniref:chloride channel protein n=1 Tax=Janibacter sp. GXQ6167 TaxID=3240791 RepID=UPI00352583B0